MENYRFNFKQHFDIDKDGIFVIDHNIQNELSPNEIKEFSSILDTIGTNSSRVCI